MATRLGIELSAAACRLIEIDGRVRPGARDAEPRVRSFAVLPPSGADTDAMLASLKGRDAAVVVWGPASEHRQVVVTAASYEAMRREATAAMATVGVKTAGALVDIAPVPGASGARRPVVVALAQSEAMLEAVRPLLAAGIRVRSLATPAMALASMAYMRRGELTPDGIEAYLAVEEMASCIALMRDGALAIARELPWGYIDNGTLRPREEIASRLALEVKQYLEAVGAPDAAQVCICGGVPELRTMSALLTTQLDVEVEPLDSLFGIDESRLPEPSDDFRDRIAELRPAWAAAADWPPHLNLLRARRRAQSRRVFAVAAVVAGVAAGVAGAWGISRSARSSAKPAAPRSASTSAPRNVPRQAPAAARPPAPSVAANAPPRPAAAAKPAPPLTSRSLIPRRSALAAAVRPPATRLTPELVAALRTPPPAPEPVLPAPQRSAPQPSASQPSSPQPSSPSQPSSPQPSSPSRPAVAPPPPVLQRPTPPPPVIARKTEALQAPEAPQAPRTSEAPQKRPAARAAKPEPILPFDASLETILYSADRKLAIIDGRIVGVGDLVRGARIIEIAPTAVLLRDGDGRLRRLTLGAVSK